MTFSILNAPCTLGCTQVPHCMTASHRRYASLLLELPYDGEAGSGEAGSGSGESSSGGDAAIGVEAGSGPSLFGVDLPTWQVSPFNNYAVRV